MWRTDSTSQQLNFLPYLWQTQTFNRRYTLQDDIRAKEGIGKRSSLEMNDVAALAKSADKNAPIDLAAYVAQLKGQGIPSQAVGMGGA